MKKSYNVLIIISFFILIVSTLYSLITLKEYENTLSSLLNDNSSKVLKINTLESELEMERTRMEDINKNNEKLSSELSEVYSSISEVESRSQAIGKINEEEANDSNSKVGFFFAKKPNTKGFIADEVYDLNSDGNLEKVHLINLDALYLQVDEEEKGRIERVELGKLVLDDAYDLKIEMNKMGNILVSYYYKGNGLPAGRRFLYVYYWNEDEGLTKVWDGSFYCEHRYEKGRVDFFLDNKKIQSVDVSEKLANLNEFKNKIAYYVGDDFKNPKAEDVFKLNYEFIMTSLDFETKENEILVNASYLAQTDFHRADNFNVGIVNTRYRIFAKEKKFVFE